MFKGQPHQHLTYAHTGMYNLHVGVSVARTGYMGNQGGIDDMRINTR